MSNIYLCSDTHFCHDREFVWKERGFGSVQEMNEEIVRRWNEVVKPDDTVYHLGDVMLNDTEAGMKYLAKLNGEIHIIRGNHDSPKRIEAYQTLPNVVYEGAAAYLKYKKFNFFLCHFPTFTGSLETRHLYENICCIYGHTHQKTNFYNDIPWAYHCGMDSHGCRPILIDDAIAEMKAKVEECFKAIGEENNYAEAD